MKLRAKFMDFEAGVPIAVMNIHDARDLGVYVNDRVSISCGKAKKTAFIEITKHLVRPGEIGIRKEAEEKYGVKRGMLLDVFPAEKPASVEIIRKKIRGNEFKKPEIETLVSDINTNRLSDIELGAFVSAVYIRGFSQRETLYLTQAMISCGKCMDWGQSLVADKHCIPGETPTIVRNSGKVKVDSIGSIVDSIFDRCKPEEIYNDGEAEFTDKNLNSLKAMVYNDEGETDFVPVSAVYRLDSPKYLREITLLGNRKIKTTENHTIFVLKNGKIQNIPAKNIITGDYVLVPVKIRKEKTIKELSLKTDFKIQNHPYKRANEKIKITPEFMRLLGYYISEGFTNGQGIFFNFGAHEKDLIEDAKKCVEAVFGIRCTINKPHKTATRVSVYSQHISKIFNDAIKAGPGALEKRIPPFVFDVSDEMKMEFIRALFEGDGYVRRGYEAIYVTASKKLATDLQYLLSLMGMSVSVSERKEGERQFPKQKCQTQRAYFIYTQAREIFGERESENVAFINLLPIKELGEIEKESIGWEFRRALKRQEYMTKQKLKTIISHIKSDDVKKLINGSISVLRVKDVKITESTSKYVYDFRVDGYNRFVAGTAPICIHNSIGGVPGNRVTPIVVAIVASAGVLMPKTSSRAITSPAGTADTMEVFCNVCFSADEIKKIVKKTGGCVVWGGALDLAPVDDKLIRIEHPLSLDPEGQVLASVMSKKKAVGAKYLVIDIPYGDGSKEGDISSAEELAKKFKWLAGQLDIKAECVITKGGQPVGFGVGPVPEAIDIIEVLNGKGPDDLREKSLELAGILLQMTKKGDKKIAKRILDSGLARKKFLEIVRAQGGNPDKDVRALLGKYRKQFFAGQEGYVMRLDNSAAGRTAKLAGAPKDIGAGIILYHKKGEKVAKGDLLFEIYAEKDYRLAESINYAAKNPMFFVGQRNAMIVKEV